MHGTVDPRWVPHDDLWFSCKARPVGGWLVDLSVLHRVMVARHRQTDTLMPAAAAAAAADSLSSQQNDDFCVCADVDTRRRQQLAPPSS